MTDTAKLETVGGRLTPIQRFVQKVEIRKRNECWLWTAHKNERGYGTFSADKTTVRAHRWLFQQFFARRLQSFEDVCHTCDNPGCVNPLHLFLGSAPVNMADASDKGRLRNGREAYCKRGHPFNGKNTRWGVSSRSGRLTRTCIACCTARTAAYKKRRNAEKKLPCHWTPDDDGIWEANCGGTFIFESDGPTENGFNFCPFCGKKILPHTGYGDDE